MPIGINTIEINIYDNQLRFLRMGMEFRVTGNNAERLRFKLMGEIIQGWDFRIIELSACLLDLNS